MKNLAALFAVCLGTSHLCSAQTLYYDRTTNPGWQGPTAWSSVDASGPFDQSWADSSIANFGSGAAATVSVTGDAAVAGLANPGSPISLGGSGGTRVLTFSGGTISGDFNFGSSLTVTGNVEQTSGNVNFAGANYSAYSGTYTASGGNTYFTQSSRVSSSTNLAVNGGTLSLELNTDNPTAGAITIDSGTLRYGRGTGTFGFNLSISSLSGNGGLLTNRTNTSVAENILTIDQAIDTEYKGQINGTGGGGNSRFALVKDGAGDLTLSGAISNLERVTTVNGGGLFLNGVSAKTFGDTVGSTAIQVNSGGLLGGTGTVATTAGDHIVIGSGGALAAGLRDLAGQTTYALGTEASLNLSSLSTGALLFDLGSDTDAGVSYDQIRLTSGALDIGTGVLNFDSFTFQLLEGFDVGTYTLFDLTGTSSLTGSLGAALTGLLSPDYQGELSRSGDNLLLTVTAIPEPSVVGIALMGGLAFAGLRRKKAGVN